MVDFSKLRSVSPEERERRDQARRLTESQVDLDKKAAGASARLKAVLTESPTLMYDRVLEPYALLYAKNDKGDEVRLKLSPFEHEEHDAFRKRLFSLDEGSELVVDGQNRMRKWRTVQGELKSVSEFHIGSVVAPETLKPELGERLTMPQSAFAVASSKRSQVAGFAQMSGQQLG